MRTSAPTLPDYAGVFLVAGSALGLQIVLTRILAVMMWHHYTFVVIGIALLGFGAAGSYLMARSPAAQEHEPPVGRRLSTAALWFGITTPLCYAMVTRVRFSPLEIAEQPQEVVALFLIYVLITVPYFFGGIVICDAIRSFRGRVGSVYFADLIGAAVGVVAAVALLEPLTGPGAIVAMGIAGVLGALAFEVGHLRRAGVRPQVVPLLVRVAVAALLLLVVLPIARDGAIDPPLAPSKEAAAAASVMPIESTSWNPLARIDTTVERELGVTMGGSMGKNTPKRPVHVVFQDGSAPTLVVRWDDTPDGGLGFLKTACAAAGHVALQAREVTDVEALAIGVGGGIDLMLALQFGVKRVTGAEMNSSTIRLLTDRYRDFTGRLVEREDVELLNYEGRHFVRSAGRQFHLIQLSGVDTYTALTSGAYVLSESYLYTREGVRELLQALRPQGVVCYSRFLFRDRPRETLRLVATAAEALEELGIREPQRHVFVTGIHWWASTLISREPFEPEVLDALRRFSAENEYEVLYDPDHPADNAFNDCMRRSPAERARFYQVYPYDVRPSVDDRPFFFNFFKWAWLRHTDEYRGHPYRMDYPVGSLCLLITLVQTVLLGALFILVPLRRLRVPIRGSSAWSAFLYFTALGIGFITVEIVLIQQLVLFLGHPTYSTTTVLPAMLFFAGLGSLTVRPGTEPGRRLRQLAWLAPAAILLCWWLTSYALDGFLGWPFAARVALAVGSIAPVAFVLGMAFPTGVLLLEQRAPELIPWGWAVNGFTTVFGSTATVLLAMEVGFSVAMIATAPLYVVGILVLARGAGARRGAVAADAAA